MSMDKLEAIPVDTHVFQMAKNYGFVKLDKQRDTKKGSNSLSDSSYREIGIIKLLE
jgi:endonuclease III